MHFCNLSLEAILHRLDLPFSDVASFISLHGITEKNSEKNYTDHLAIYVTKFEELQ